MTKLERITSSGLLSKTVNRRQRFYEQNTGLTSINSARQRLAAARSDASVYFAGFEFTETTKGANNDSKLPLPVTISDSQICK